MSEEVCGARSVYIKGHDGCARCGLKIGHDGEHQERRPNECVVFLWKDGEAPKALPDIAIEWVHRGRPHGG